MVFVNQPLASPRSANNSGRPECEKQKSLLRKWALSECVTLFYRLVFFETAIGQKVCLVLWIIDEVGFHWQSWMGDVAEELETEKETGTEGMSK